MRHKYVKFGYDYLKDSKEKNMGDLRYKNIINILIRNLIEFYLDLDEVDNILLKKITIIQFLNLIISRETIIYEKEIITFGRGK